MEAKSPSLRKNPSRETCEGIIRRILMTEVLEKGKNEHFRTAADFMKYFESLATRRPTRSDQTGAARHPLSEYAEG